MSNDLYIPPKPIRLSEKQIEYLKYANAQYNIKSGATRSGKTHLDYLKIPERIDQTTGEGLSVIFGASKGSIERNIIEPLQKMYGPRYISHVSSDNTMSIFGRKVHVLGAEKRNRVSQIRGMTIEYAYGDEIVDWSEEVFNIIQTRLSLPNSIFDGTCNPKEPEHWFNKFLERSRGTTADGRQRLFDQSYKIYDNPFLSQSYIEGMEQDMQGVYFDRYILGKWTLAEGLINERFAKKPEDYYVDRKDIPPLYEVSMGVDFGGNNSKHAFVVTGTPYNYDGLYVLASKRLETGISASEVAKKYVEFLRYVEGVYGYRIDYTYADSAESVIPLDMEAELEKQGLQRSIRGSYKRQINDRIEATSILIGKKKLFYTEDSESFKKALASAVWKGDRDSTERLDDGTTDIDTLDAFEYSWSNNLEYLVTK